MQTPIFVSKVLPIGFSQLCHPERNRGFATPLPLSVGASAPLVRQRHDRFRTSEALAPHLFASRTDLPREV